MWTQPQADLPGREPLHDALLHGRRERVFLVLASMFVVAAAALPLLGLAKSFGASWIVRAIGVEPAVMLLVPLGVFALPIALLAANLVGELYGKTRARWLVLATAVVWLGVLAIAWTTDRLPDYDNRTTTAFPVAVSLVGCGLVTFIVQLEVFSWIAVRWVRHVAASVVGLAAGWGAWWLVVARVEVPGAPAGDALAGTALGAAGFTAAVVIVGTLPVVVLGRALAVYLRVERRGAPALADDELAAEPAFVAKQKKPWSTDELAFFDAGDQP